ncbi:hypothetical protein FB451DRAFT_1188157 [Mycena latifolia]|nr:hypothetical protein FB451DRAFT_1188157 [Mycena latifolia]
MAAGVRAGSPKHRVDMAVRRRTFARVCLRPPTVVACLPGRPPQITQGPRVKRSTRARPTLALSRRRGGRPKGSKDGPRPADAPPRRRPNKNQYTGTDSKGLFNHILHRLTAHLYNTADNERQPERPKKKKTSEALRKHMNTAATSLASLFPGDAGAANKDIANLVTDTLDAVNTALNKLVPKLGLDGLLTPVDGALTGLLTGLGGILPPVLALVGGILIPVGDFVGSLLSGLGLAAL